MSLPDVEMKEVTTEEKQQTTNTGAEVSAVVVADLKANIALVEKAATSKEIRFLTRVLRKISAVRKKLTTKILSSVINQVLATNLQLKEELLSYITKIHEQSAEMDVEHPTEETDQKKEESLKTSFHPEVETYLHLLVTIFLIDKNHYSEATVSSSSLIKRIQNHYRRTMFPLAAKCFFYYSRSFELANRLSEIRGTLLAAHRTATLHHDDEGQATILNLLLRNYLHYNLYDQAYKLVSKTTFPEGSASSNQFARYLYYQGRIKSIQLDYTEAYKCLEQAIRKAPTITAKGFRLAVHKLLCIVQLLLGEIPERAVFRQPGLVTALNPYLQLTKAVRVGALSVFNEVVDRFGDVFIKDKTYTLIQRLHHNVIKTGLRKINLSYSRIHLADICAKLHLDSVDDSEFIVTKAIRDGVIEATIDHDGGYIQSKELLDVYTTQEPQEAFHKRISLCLHIHNEAVKAMRFPPDAHKPNKESEEARKERLKQEQELAKNLAEDDDDDDF